MYLLAESPLEIRRSYVWLSPHFPFARKDQLHGNILAVTANYNNQMFIHLGNEHRGFVFIHKLSHSYYVFIVKNEFPPIIKLNNTSAHIQQPGQQKCDDPTNIYRTMERSD